MIHFNKLEYTIENPIEVASTHFIVFPFTGDPNDIIHLQPGCSCTAECGIEGSNVVAQYTDNVGETVPLNTASKHYPNGLVPFEKQITVFLNDGLPLHIHKGMTKEFNPDKKNVVLTFKGNVKVF